jgi:RNA polymerase-binding transcription factor DksA
MSDLTEDQLEDLQATLEAERDSLDEELAEYGKNVNGDWEGTSGSKGGESDPNDAADNIETLSTNVPLVEELESRKREIDKALERMKKGSYGTCEACKQPIPFDRLEANPAASKCVEHAA